MFKIFRFSTLLADCQRIHRLGSHLAASHQHTRYCSGGAFRCSICGAHYTHRRPAGRQLTAAIIRLIIGWCRCGCFDFFRCCQQRSLLLLCFRLSNERWRLSATHGHSAWRRFAIYFRCTSGWWFQSFSAELHKVGNCSKRSGHCVLDQFCAHRVSWLAVQFE